VVFFQDGYGRNKKGGGEETANVSANKGVAE
jgi:hypothetical protein